MQISPKVQQALDDARSHLMRFAVAGSLTVTVISAVLLPLSHADAANLPPGNLAEHPQAGSAIDCQKRRVSDGDTVTGFCNGRETRIRLYCIDAPETSQGEWGKASGAYLESMMDHRFKLIIHDTDRYGRSIGEIFNSDGRNLNVEMAGSGAAVVYQQYCNDSHYYDAEDFAKQNGFGVWTATDPLIQAPWDYRRQQREITAPDR
ncbi:MAG: thermonuclease family protein [Marinospirillum sp.]|uniref:thermonuclease family protein n=1 Tax=Marinospirillum sp. TaxID=2183934 RepID=UPI001A08A731|nr:thermonuclease family protein [Marinospirillum sp.]MBE0506682.1 thermonuclease family protein [Marinospirillum sp.]